jgi:Tfp pilus assembly protein PilN
MIAARRAEKHRIEKRTRNLVYGILAEAGLFLVVISYMIVQLVATQGQAADLRDKISKLKPEVEAIQGLQKETAALQPKVTALDDARTNTLYWYTAIQNLTSSLSNSTYLSSIDTKGDPSGAASTGVGSVATGATMSVAGTSLTASDVGMMMLRMNQYPQFDKVTLSEVDEQPQMGSASMNGSQQVKFQIAIDLHPTAQPKDTSNGLGNGNVQKS